MQYLIHLTYVLKVQTSNGSGANYCKCEKWKVITDWMVLRTTNRYFITVVKHVLCLFIVHILEMLRIVICICMFLIAELCTMHFILSFVVCCYSQPFVMVCDMLQAGGKTNNIGNLCLQFLLHNVQCKVVFLKQYARTVAFK